MDLGVHLPLIPFGEELSLARLGRTVDAARECGLAAISANDHLVFRTPWLDGPAALASIIERSGRMTLATTVALPAVRGPAALAKALMAIDLLSEGRCLAGVGPGSSERDYAVAGVPFAERWARFDDALIVLRAALRGDLDLAPVPARPIPVWVGSWGSPAGLARVARAGDGWLASAYNTSPEEFAAARGRLSAALTRRGRDAAGFPSALATMWTWVTDDRGERARMLRDVLAPLLNRDPGELGEQLCVGPPDHCAALLSRYAAAGCDRVYLWPLRGEPSQIERIAGEIAPALSRPAAR